MGSIAFSVTDTAHGTVSKSYTVSDADIARMVAAYQNDANVNVNGTATRNQVLLYIAKTWLKEAQSKVSAVEYAAAHATIAIVPDFSAT